MHFLKRISVAAYSLISIALEALIVVYLWGAYTNEIKDLFAQYADAKPITMVAAAGLLFINLIMLLRALFKKNKRLIEIQATDGSKVYVSREAVSSQIRTFVAHEGNCRLSHVSLKIVNKNKLDLTLKLEPLHLFDLGQYAVQFKEKLLQNLELLVGDSIQSLDIIFVGLHTATDDDVDDDFDDFDDDDDDEMFTSSSGQSEQKEERASKDLTSHDHSEIRLSM